MINSPLYKNLGLAGGMDALMGGGDDPIPPRRRAVIDNKFQDMPLYVPKDTQLKMLIQDSRKMNPATGQPFKTPGALTSNVNPNVVSLIARQALSKGVDPNTALAIALQETHMGNKNEDVGSAWSYLPDEGIDDPYEKGANSMVKALTEKLAYAKQLGYDKKGEAYALQAYNGYGKLKPQLSANQKEYYYGIPVTKDHPLNMAENPVYGKTIMSIRDEIIKKHPQIQALIKKEQEGRRDKPMQSPALAYADSKE